MMNKYVKVLSLFAVLAIILTGCSSTGTSVAKTADNEKTIHEQVQDMNAEMQIKVEVNGNVLHAVLENNSSAKALYEKLAADSITIHMHDYGSFEKVGDLGFRLPTNDKQIDTQAGDIILYQGDKLVFYYDQNSWNFTQIGRFKDVDQAQLKNVFGNGDITAVLSR